MSTRFDAYAAGLVDGEGCITAKSTKAGTGMGIRVLIGMATKAGEVLRRMQVEYSGTLITQTPANPKHSDVMTWTVTGAEAASFLNRILPHLLLKEEQALLALKIEEIRTSLPKIGNRDHHRWTPEALERCQRIYRRIMELNERGPTHPERTPAGGTEIARLVAGLWVTDQADLFSDLGWEPFSGTWPRSGYMSNGQAFELPTSVPPITASVYSSWLPTPTATTYGSNQSPSPGAAVRPSLDGLVRMLPTPRAADPSASMTAPAAMQHVRDGNGSLAEVLGFHLLPTPKANDQRDSNGAAEARRKSPDADGGVSAFPDAESIRRDRRGIESPDTQAGRSSPEADRCSEGFEWGSYAPAIRRWERLTRPAPSPTLPNSNGRPQLNAAFAEWMMGVPAGHVTSVPISRAHQLKAIGNGVCPPQAVAAYSSLLAQAVAA